MNIQARLFEVSAGLRARAATLAAAAAQRVDALKVPMATLAVAGRELNKVAQRHVSRFVRENSTLALTASTEVTAIARATFATLAARPTPKTRARKSQTTRKRAARKAA